MTEGAPVQPCLEKVIYENVPKEPQKRKYSWDNPDWRKKVYETGYVFPTENGEWQVKKYGTN